MISILVLLGNNITACRFVFVDVAAAIINKLREEGCLVLVDWVE